MENNKPITLVREDFVNGVARLINESGLPLFIVEDALRSLLNGVSELSRQQIEQHRQEYAQAMAMSMANAQMESAPTEDGQE